MYAEEEPVDISVSALAIDAYEVHNPRQHMPRVDEDCTRQPSTPMADVMAAKASARVIDKWERRIAYL